MSAPKTNIETQKRRHWGPLLGIAVVLVFVALITAWYAGWLAFNAEPPAGADVQIDGRTGEAEPASE